jgi:hypothetical protein
MTVVKYAASAGERILEHLPELCHPVLGPESGEEEDTENGRRIGQSRLGTMEGRPAATFFLLPTRARELMMRCPGHGADARAKRRRMGGATKSDTRPISLQYPSSARPFGRRDDGFRKVLNPIYRLPESARYTNGPGFFL